MLSRRSLMILGALAAPVAALGSTEGVSLQQILDAGRVPPPGRYVLYDKLVLREGHILDGLEIEWRGPEDAAAMIEIVHVDVGVTNCHVVSKRTRVPCFRLSAWTPDRISNVAIAIGDSDFLIA